MSHDLHLYGSTDTIYFKITLAGVGVNPTLAAGDVKIFKHGGSVANVNTLPSAVDGTNMVGLFAWTPTSAEATCEVFVLNIKDQTDPKAFDENCLIVSTGGNASARFSG